jgi:uncharacterized cupin superfamily protein
LSVAEPVAAIGAASAPLEPEPLDPDQVIAGDPRTSSYVLTEGADGTETGVWRCTPGTFRDVEADEVFVVIEGRATIEWEGGAAVEVGPGDVCTLEPGTRTVWTVHETLLKGFRIEP